jgi:ATP-dependent Clp protease ATP-binding subunit ClpA
VFERFTAKARRALVVAQEEARVLGHPFIGTEHILLGLAGSPGVAGDIIRTSDLTQDDLRDAARAIIGKASPGQPDARALETIGIDLDAVRSSVEAEFGPGVLDMTRAARRREKKTKPGASPPFTPAAKKSLELSLRRALEVGDNFIGTEHLLLGVLFEPRFASCRAVERAGGQPDALVAAVKQAISQRKSGDQSGEPDWPGSFATRARGRAALLRRRRHRRARPERPDPPPT